MKKKTRKNCGEKFAGKPSTSIEQHSISKLLPRKFYTVVSNVKDSVFERKSPRKVRRRSVAFGRDEISPCSTQDEGLANTVGIGNEMRRGGRRCHHAVKLGSKEGRKRGELPTLSPISLKGKELMAFFLSPSPPFRVWLHSITFRPFVLPPFSLSV